jgi:hypothetical protein
MEAGGHGESPLKNNLPPDDEEGKAGQRPDGRGRMEAGEYGTSSWEDTLPLDGEEGGFG